jgi:hypothetical protein
VINLSGALRKTTAILVLLVITHGKTFGQNDLRTIAQLTADTSGWTAFKDATKIARNKFEVLPADPTKAKDALYQTQVTTHSLMGAIIYFSGGILIDNGWIRILGSGSQKLNRSLPEWNKGKTYRNFGEKPGFLLIADDAIGGFFAVNGGALGSNIGKVYYLAPDDLKWESQDMGYADFINFCLVGDMDQYYSGLRWKQWKTDLQLISGNEGFSIYPFPWTVEGKDIAKDSKKAVPIQELYNFEINQLNKAKK